MSTVQIQKRVCSRCGSDKTYFNKSENRERWFLDEERNWICKKCSSKQWYKENREYNLAYRREWYKENREYLLEYHMEWYKQNREYWLTHSREWYKQNPNYNREYRARRKLI